MKRYQFQHNMLTFSYLDSDGDKAGKVLIALHAHWMEGMSFASLAKALSPEWRVIALDQRGHGHSTGRGERLRNLPWCGAEGCPQERSQGVWL